MRGKKCRIPSNNGKFIVNDFNSNSAKNLNFPPYDIAILLLNPQKLKKKIK